MARKQRPRQPEASPQAIVRPSPFFKLALVAFGCVLALALCEGAVRLLSLGPDTNVVFADNLRLSNDPVLQYELIPGSPDGKTHINAAGLRDKDYALAKPAGVFRILVIGDSIAYGFGIPQGDALSEQLETLLRSYHSPQLSRFEVLNLGVSGYNIAQIAQNLRLRGMQWQPDLIVYAYCLNDPGPSSFELDSLKAKLSPATNSYRDALLHQGQRLIARSRLLLLARFAWQRWREPPPTAAVMPQDAQWQAVRGGSYAEYFSRLYQGEDLSRLQGGLRLLAEITRERHVPLVGLVFPLFVDLGKYPLAPLHAAVAESFQRAGLRSYDLLPVFARMFEQHGPLFVLNALHPNALGVRLAALYALHRFERDGSLPAASSAWTPQTEMFQLDAVLEGVIAQVNAASAPP